MRPWISVLLVGALVWAGACSPHKRGALGAAGRTVADLATECDETPRPTVDWWRAFEDETLHGLVVKALAENPTIDAAISGVRVAEAFLIGQRAADLPSVNINGSLGRSRSIGFMGGLSTTWSISGAASYELDLWGRRKALERDRFLALEGSVSALSSAMVSVSAQVAETWYLLVEGRAQVALGEARVTLLAERLDLVSLRYGRGSVSAQEVYGARSVLAAEEAELQGLCADVGVVSHALAILVNQKPGRLEKKLPLGSLFPLLPPLSQAPLSSRLILGRPDMMQALKEVERADEAVAFSLADRFPTFSLTAGYGRSGSESGSFTGSGPIWSVGGSLLAPLVDWGARKSKVEADRAAFQGALARYRSTALLAFKEAEDALLRYHHGEVAVAHLKEALDSAVSNRTYVKSRYLQGTSDYLALLASRISENEARGRLLSGQRLLLSHRIGIARALGGSFGEGWSPSA